MQSKYTKAQLLDRISYLTSKCGGEKSYRRKLERKLSRICLCTYESDCHGIEMIKSPSGREWAIGGTHMEDRFRFCPWCGGNIHAKSN